MPMFILENIAELQPTEIFLPILSMEYYKHSQQLVRNVPQ